MKNTKTKTKTEHNHNKNQHSYNLQETKHPKKHNKECATPLVPFNCQDIIIYIFLQLMAKFHHIIFSFNPISHHKVSNLIILEAMPLKPTPQIPLVLHHLHQ
jgi:hypothetical protein